MKQIATLVAEFSEALVRGYITPLEMGRIITQMSASLSEYYPEVFDGLPINLDDVGDEVWLAVKNFDNHDEQNKL